MNKLLITGLLICSSLYGSSTCIAIYIANGNIYVAADSRRSFIFNAGKNDAKFGSVCKIHHVGANYFAISGFDDSGLLREATKALQQTSNVDTAIIAFGTAMDKRYKHLMDDARRVYPDKFKKFLSDGLGNVSFLGFYNGTPNVVNIQFLCYLDNGKLVTAYRIRQIFDITVLGISKDITGANPEELPSKAIMQQSPEFICRGPGKDRGKKTSAGSKRTD